MIFKKLAPIVFLVAALTVPAFAQQKPAASDATPTRQQILNLFDAIQLRRTLSSSQEIAMKNAVSVAQQMFQQQVGPDNKPQMDEMINGVMEDVRRAFSVDEMVEAVIPIYQRHFTTADIDAFLAFQNSPVGKKMTDLQPVMMKESSDAVTAIQQRALPELMKKLDERVRKALESQPQGKADLGK
jgi:hypothetical protein